MFYEMLSERTLALAQRDLLAHPDRGYAPYMVEFLAPVLRKCVENGILIVGNFGSASPMTAARRLHALARDQGVRSEEHTYELQSIMSISYADVDVKKNKITYRYIYISYT